MLIRAEAATSRSCTSQRSKATAAMAPARRWRTQTKSIEVDQVCRALWQPAVHVVIRVRKCQHTQRNIEWTQEGKRSLTSRPWLQIASCLRITSYFTTRLQSPAVFTCPPMPSRTCRRRKNNWRQKACAIRELKSSLELFALTQID